MKKQILFGILFLLFTNLLAQDKEGNDYFFGDNFHFHGNRTDLRMMHYSSLTFQISDKRIWTVFDSFDPENKFNADYGKITPKSKILLGIKLTPTLKNYFTAEVPNFSKFYYSYLIPDSSEATVVAMGINSSNIADYQYRMVLDDSLEIQKWSHIPGLEMKYGARKPYGKIGTFRFPGRKLLVEVAHKDSIWIRDGYIMDWTRRIKPPIEQIIVRGASTYGYYGLNLDSLRRTNHGIDSPTNSDIIKWTFEKDSVQEFDLCFAQHETRPYSIYLIKDIQNKRDTIRIAWWEIGNRFTVENKYLKDVGQYTLFIQQTGTFGEFSKHEMTQIDFKIVESLSTDVRNGYTPKQILPFALGMLTIVGLGFIAYRLRVRRNLKMVERDRKLLAIQMQGIRSQLNPHFMFNSINSIQNLIQKGDISAAKNYLQTFSSLTREVLEDSEKEMHSLSAELKLTRDYLIMEQLRFGFSYQIKQELDLHTDNVDIPVMFLQPFVENAVKHGVSNLLDRGSIAITVSNRDNDLILEVTDNGQGMKAGVEESATGYGIKLSKKRIALLNQLYPQNRIDMELLNDQPGTIVRITFVDWLN
ncbi:sensor histidine kinase [Sphingobacterium thalpophilum]|uniref:sensor histidine kinase n=1 Tax=Sphingobacterium thalpophilum TaxID=259 RepID=UPI0031D92BA3